MSVQHGADSCFLARLYYIVSISRVAKLHIRPVALAYHVTQEWRLLPTRE